MNPESSRPWLARLEELLMEARTRPLEPPEHAELNHLLRTQPEARTHAAQWLFDDVSLTEHLRLAQVETLFMHEGDALGGNLERTAIKSARFPWLQWRPLTAAAAGLIIGLFSASLVFAMGTQRTIQHSLPLANASFEEDLNPAAEGVPVQFALWSGDFTAITEAQQGIIPKDGRRMLRFLRSDSSVSSGVDKAPAGNLYQVMDMRPFRRELANGQARVDWSAWFNWVPGQGEHGMTFATNVWAFTGSTSILPVNWKEHLYQETAKSGHKIKVDDTPRTWQPVAGSMIVPPDADFLVVELKAIPAEADAAGPRAFSGCFADAVQMILRTDSRQPVITSPGQ